MDFSYSEEQEAVRELANRIFGERSTHERLREIEAGSRRRGSLRPRAVVRAGRSRASRHRPPRGGRRRRASTSWPSASWWRLRAAPRPTCPSSRRWSTARRPSPLRDGRAAPALASGRRERRADRDRGACRAVRRCRRPRPGSPLTTATPDGSGWVLEGTKACVAAGLLADTVLVPATLLDADGSRLGIGVFVVGSEDRAARRAGAAPARTPRPAGSRPCSDLSGVRVGEDVLLGGRGADGASIVADLSHAAPRRSASSRPASAPPPWSSPASTPRPGSSSASPSPRSRPSGSGSPTPTWTRRLCGSRRGRRHGACPRGFPRRPRWRPPSTGRPRGASVPSTRRHTSTVGWASTGTTPCTGSSS